MSRPRVVLPTPGGPQRISELREPVSICFRKGVPTPTMCSCPTNSSSVRGRMPSARGRVASGEVVSADEDGWRESEGPGGVRSNKPMRRLLPCALEPGFKQGNGTGHGRIQRLDALRGNGKQVSLRRHLWRQTGAFIADNQRSGI